MRIQSNTSLSSAPWLFHFTLLELVKGGYLEVKKWRGGRVKCKEWSLTNRFLSRCTKTGGYKKSEDGEFPPTEGSPYIHPGS